MDLEGLIARYGTPLVGLFLSWDVDPAEAEFLVQSTFVEAHFAGPRLPSEAPEAGRFLRRIARNVYRNWRRTKRRREQRFQSLDGTNVAAPPDRDGEDEDAQVHRAIVTLPRRLRQVIWIHYLEETSISDTAALLGISTRAVEGRLHQARQALRERLSARSAERSQ